MPNAAIIDLADAVVTALNAASLSQSFTATRAYQPYYDLEDSTALKVVVIPRRDDGITDSRASRKHEYTIDVAVQRKPTQIGNSDLDPLVKLTEEIADLFQLGVRQSGAVLKAGQIRILFLEEHLQRCNQFTSVVSLTYVGWRE